MLSGELIRSLISQELKGWQGFKPWALGIIFYHYKRRKGVSIKDPIFSQKTLSQAEEKTSFFSHNKHSLSKLNQNSSSTMAPTTSPITT